MRIGDLIPDAAELQAEIAALPQPVRVALALQLVRDIDESSCALPLTRLAHLAEDHVLSIRREEFIRRNVR